MNGRIFGFQRFVWWPKCTPASSSERRGSGREAGDGMAWPAPLGGWADADDVERSVMGHVSFGWSAAPLPRPTSSWRRGRHRQGRHRDAGAVRVQGSVWGSLGLSWAPDGPPAGGGLVPYGVGSVKRAPA